MAYASGIDERASRRGGLASTGLWAAGSLAVIAFAVVWAYGLGARNPSEIPELSADGVWRVPPELPGGRVFPDQERAVYERFETAAAPQSETPAPSAAPERPTEADIAAAREAALNFSSDEPIGSGPFLEIVEEVVARSDAGFRRRLIDLDFAAPRTGSALEPTKPDFPPNVGAGAPPLPPRVKTHHGRIIINQAESAGLAVQVVEPGEIEARDAAGAAAAQRTGADVLANAAEDLAASAAAAQSAPAEGTAAVETGADAPPAPAESAPATIEIAEAEPNAASGASLGGWRVQLGALDTQDIAQRVWGELQSAHPDLLGSLEFEIKPIDWSEDRQLYRLKVGAFETRAAAADVCRQLLEREVDCFPSPR